MPRPSSKLSTSFTAVKYPKTWTPRPSYFSRSQKSTTYKSWRMHAPSSWPRIWRRRMSSIPWSGLTFSDAPIWRSKGYVAFEIGSHHSSGAVEQAEATPRIDVGVHLVKFFSSRHRSLTFIPRLAFLITSADVISHLNYHWSPRFCLF